MGLVCIDNHKKYKFPITVGKEYEVLKPGKEPDSRYPFGSVYIRDDRGYFAEYALCYFETLSYIRDKKLEEILK